MDGPSTQYGDILTWSHMVDKTTSLFCLPIIVFLWNGDGKEAHLPFFAYPSFK